MTSSKSKTPEFNHLNEVIELLMEEALNEKLIIIIGAGVSMGLTDGKAPSWNELIRRGFDYGKERGLITDLQHTNWAEQLRSSDIDDLLGAAEFMGRKLGSPDNLPYARWLEHEFQTIQPSNTELVTTLKHISELDIPLCTLNYDHLLETITKQPTLLVSDIKNTASWIRREKTGILHLHGSWDTPKSCILGIRDYAATQVNQVRDLFQRNLAIFNRILFIGCGDTFSDPNFSALINWLKTEYQELTPMHYALTLESDVENKKIRPCLGRFCRAAKLW